MNRRRAMVRAGAAWAAAVALLALESRSARANPMDLAPERLVKPCSPIPGFSAGELIPCGGAKTQGDVTKGNFFQADHDAWARLMSQYAMAIAPTGAHPAHTIGYGGFELALFGTLTTISNGEEWVKKGTEGPVTKGRFSSRNDSPDPVLQVYGVMGRKGLPYGFEIQGSVGYLANTELLILGGGIRWSIFEGFRRGAPGVIPDVSVGGYVNTMTGSSKVKITVPAFEVHVSKPFTVAKQVLVQPYIGWQMLWILADSAVIDLTPGVDGLAECNARPSTPAERGADTGEFNCQKRLPNGGIIGDDKAGSARLDLNNNVVFNNLRLTRQRIMLGVGFRYEIVNILLHLETDLFSPDKGMKDGDHRIDGLAKQVTFGMVTGVVW